MQNEKKTTYKKITLKYIRGNRAISDVVLLYGECKQI